MTPTQAPLVVATAALLALGGCAHADPAQADDPNPPAARRWAPPAYDQAFGAHWFDGRAELSTYDLVYPRYGERRRGTASMVFVTEDLSPTTYVKPEIDPSAGVGALKLNLMMDFPTGIYDYHTMTSAFVATAARGWVRPGDALKVSYSSQEWCGHVFAQTRFAADHVHDELHSYFDGEGDVDRSLPRPDDALAEDLLWLWARGLAGPALEPGESLTIPLWRSLDWARMHHTPGGFDEGLLTRRAETGEITVPAGTFTVQRRTVEVTRSETGRSYPPTPRGAAVTTRWTFQVEVEAPHRLIRFSRDDGLSGELVASTRDPYWSHNAEADEHRLESIGLTPRPPRTP